LHQKKTDPDIGKITRLLRNAWYTETQLNLTKDNPELIPYANLWACVQSYYAVYLCMRSFLIAMNHSSADKNTHTDTLESINKEIDKRPDLFPNFWRILCDGNPNDSRTTKFKNTENGIQINHSISSLNKNISFVDRYCQFLKTTRKRSFDEKRKKYLTKNGAKRLTKKDIENILKNMHPTTIFDCLFRLRIRSNYHDSEIFMPNIVSKNEALAFNESLRTICSHSLLIFEILISGYIKSNQYTKITNDFLRGLNFESPLKNRLNTILAFNNGKAVSFSGT